MASSTPSSPAQPTRAKATNTCVKGPIPTGSADGYRKRIRPASFVITTKSFVSLSAFCGAKWGEGRGEVSLSLLQLFRLLDQFPDPLQQTPRRPAIQHAMIKAQRQ